MQARCACGWSGDIGLLTKHSAGHTTCPDCGGSGGLLFYLSEPTPEERDYLRRLWEASRVKPDLMKIKVG